MSEKHYEQLDASSSEQDNVIDVQAVFMTVSMNRKFILRVTLIGLCLFALIAFLLPAQYTGKVAFLPPGAMPSASVSAAVSQLGQMGSIGLLGGIGKTTGDLYVGILKSDSVKRYMVERFKLLDVYKAKNTTSAALALSHNTTIEVGAKDPIVTVRVVDRNPERARDLANGYLDALESASDRMALSDAAQRRVFFERQLSKEKDALANAEVDLKISEEKTGMILPSGQTSVQINTIARTRAEIASREVQLAALSQHATEQNSNMVILRSEIASLRQQLNTLQSGSSDNGNLPTGKVPEVALEYIRKQREVKYHETLFELLARQYEVARIDEAKEGPALQVLDRAVTPDIKSGPPRVFIVIGGTLFGALLSIMWVLVKAAKSRALSRNKKQDIPR